MRKKVVNKVMVNWAASFLSVVILLSMAAAPALALVAANSVNSSSVIDRSIKTRDIKRNAINSSRIRDYSIRKEDIHSGSINKYKLTRNAVNSYKIEDGSVMNNDIADNSINTAKIVDGSVTNADIANGANISDTKISYSTKTGYLAISPSAFNPSHEAIDYWSNYEEITLVTGTVGYFYVPAQLPDGAVITKLRYTAKDNNSGATEYTNALLRRVAHSNQTSVQVVNATTQYLGSSTSWRTVSGSASANPVDNNMYSYVVEIYFSDASDLTGGNIVIEYDYKR